MRARANGIGTRSCSSTACAAASTIEPTAVPLEMLDQRFGVVQAAHLNQRLGRLTGCPSRSRTQRSGFTALHCGTTASREYRRAGLLEWARAGNVIIEDDYDAEYRYDRAPVRAIHALAPDRVIYLGSVSKTLAPAMCIGWMVLPDHLVGVATKFKMSADLGSSLMDQIAFAQLVAFGDYDRHLRQMRRRYIVRRNALLRAKSLPTADEGVRSLPPVFNSPCTFRPTISSMN